MLRLKGKLSFGGPQAKDIQSALPFQTFFGQTFCISPKRNLHEHCGKVRKVEKRMCCEIEVNFNSNLFTDSIETLLNKE